MPLSTPPSLLHEHQKLHDDIARAVHLPGALGEAAGRISRILQVHVRKEEAYALPPLGMLNDALKPAPDPAQSREVALLADELQTHMKDMLAEHRMLMAALQEFVTAARQSDRIDLADVALRLLTHIRLEEEVMYPAAIMLGQYLRLKLKIN